MFITNGVDIVEVRRLQRLSPSVLYAFINKIFSETELNLFFKLYSKTDIVLFRKTKSWQASQRQYEYLAARFAAKEAVIKAFGLSLFSLPFKDIEILGGNGSRPYLNLSKFIQSLEKNYLKDKKEKIFDNLADPNLKSTHSLSLSTERAYAVAFFSFFVIR